MIAWWRDIPNTILLEKYKHDFFNNENARFKTGVIIWYKTLWWWRWWKLWKLWIMNCFAFLSSSTNTFPFHHTLSTQRNRAITNKDVQSSQHFIPNYNHVFCLWILSCNYSLFRHNTSKLETFDTREWNNTDGTRNKTITVTAEASDFRTPVWRQTSLGQVTGNTWQAYFYTQLQMWPPQIPY